MNFQNEYHEFEENREIRVFLAENSHRNINNFLEFNALAYNLDFLVYRFAQKNIIFLKNYDIH